MSIAHQHQKHNARILLVDKDTGLDDISAVEPECHLLMPSANQFVMATNKPTRITDSNDLETGWWNLELTEQETAEAGTLTLVAMRENNYPWRDLVTILPEQAEPEPKPEQPTAGEGKLEALAAVARTEAGSFEIDAVLEIEETPTAPGELENILVNGEFEDGLTQWRIHCPDSIEAITGEDGLTLVRVGAESNCQLFQVLSLTPGDYRLEMEAETPMTVRTGLHVLQHGRPYTNLGTEDMEIGPGSGIYGFAFNIPEAQAEIAQSTRVRVWLGNMEKNDRMTIKRVTLAHLEARW